MHSKCNNAKDVIDLLSHGVSPYFKSWPRILIDKYEMFHHQFTCDFDYLSWMFSSGMKTIWLDLVYARRKYSRTGLIPPMTLTGLKLSCIYMKYCTLSQMEAFRFFSGVKHLWLFFTRSFYVLKFRFWDNWSHTSMVIGLISRFGQQTLW